MSWSLATLGDLCEVSTGQSAPQEADAFSDIGRPFIRAGSLDQLVNGGSEDALEKISEENARRFRMRLFPAGTIVFAKSGMSATLGRVYRLRSSCYVVSHLATLIPTERLDGVFLLRWLEANPPSRFIENEAYPSIKTSEIQNVQIPFPEFTEQRRIAAVLDKANSVRQKRKQALNQCEDLKASIMDSSLRESNETVTETIGALLDSGVIELHKDGNHGANYPRAEEFVGKLDGGLPFITAKNLRLDGSIGEEEVAYLGEEKAQKLTIGWLTAGDVLLAHNATVGPVGIFRGEWERALIGTSLTCFRPNLAKTSTEAIYAALSDPAFQKQLRKQMKQTTRNQVPITAQRELRIRLPSGNAISILAQKLARLRTIYSKHELFLRDADLLFASLCQRAFAGRL